MTAIATQSLSFPASELHRDWEPAYSWAKKNGIREQLFRVIATLKISDRPNLFGSFLAQINSPASLSWLESWRETEDAADDLYQLAIAAQNDPIHFYKKITDKIPAKEQLDDLKNFYLIALLIERLPPINRAEQEWHELLRMWVLTHAINRSYWKNFKDEHLRFVSTRLRMASDNSQNWMEFLLKLRPSAPIQQFDALNHYIIHKSELMLTKAEQTTGPGIRFDLLKHLKSIAHYDQSQEPDTAYFSSLLLQQIKFHKAGTSSNPPILEELPDEDVAFTASRLKEDDVQEEEEILARIDVDENLSYEHQMLEAGKVFLFSAEELQFLPWSWQKPNPKELEKLNEWIEQSQASNDSGDKMLAADIWVALHTGNSLRRALDIPFSSAIGGDWSLNPDTLTLQKIPPQRLQGWKPNEEQLKWVAPIADKLELPIPKPLTGILKKYLAKHTDPKLLGDLWNSKWGSNQEERFRKTIGKLIPRLTPGILSGALFQNSCLASGDPVLARLLSSHPTSALSGACSYAGWNYSQIQVVLAKLIPGFSIQSELVAQHNVIGSRLDPIEFLLLDSIRKSTKLIKNLSKENEPVNFHNYYTAYLAVMLLSATGARPVTDPFEKIRHFDFSECFVYVNDKSNKEIRRGRPIPLPDSICQYVATQYLAHLKNMAHTISPANPALADEINRLESNSINSTMPFLFFLKEGASDWESVSEKSIKDLGLFDWPLPLNLFRHRISRKLRHMGADPEVVDAVLGHSDGTTLTYSDYSFRIWMDDMLSIRPLLEKLFSELSFEMLPGWEAKNQALPVIGVQRDTSPLGKTRLFGIEARERQRKEDFISTISSAARQIDQFLSGRLLSDLNSDEMHELSKELLFMKNGMLHPRGYIKYQHLISQTDLLWQENRKKCHFKKRYFRMEEEKSIFTDAAPGAIGIFKELREKLAEISLALKANMASAKTAGDIAAIFLCLENRITSVKLLQDTIKNGIEIRMINIGGKAYLEHSRHITKATKPHEEVPVKRFMLSDKCASLIDLALSKSKGKEFIDHPVPPLLQPFADILFRHHRIKQDASFQELLVTLAMLVDQVNAMTWTGIATGYLAERVDSYSVMWRDLARLELGYAIETPFADSGDIETREKSSKSKSRLSAAWQPLQFDTLHSASCSGVSAAQMEQAAHSLLEKMEKIISDYILDKSGPYAAIDRKEMKRKILALIDDNDHAGKISPAIQMLVHWGCSLLHRPRKDGYIQLKSIQRYLNALVSPFKQIGFATDLVAMDDDGVTDFYSRLLESLEVKDTNYVASRLVDFHQWAKAEYAIEDPDWGELPATFSTAHVSPGIITEEDYQLALNLLLGKSAIDHREMLAPAFLLLLCYRFGLRSAEALGLKRDDWQDYGDLFVVTVQNNTLRSLKVSTSRRQVPLLFELCELEKEIINKWHTNLEAQYGDDMSVGMFFRGRSEWQPRKALKIKSSVIAALKAATNNPKCTLHHARHSAANRVAISICCKGIQGWDRLGGEESNKADMERILLGTTGPSRRKVRAIGRYLGHTRRETTLRNYLHFIGDHANALMKPVGNGKLGVLQRAIHLECFPKATPVSPESLIPPPPAKATPWQLLKYFRLISMGKQPEEAGHSLGIDLKLAASCHDLLLSLDKKMQLGNTRLTKGKEAFAPFEFLKRINGSAWPRLFDLAKSCMDGSGNNAPVIPSISMNEIAEMIGATRQLLMWQPEHFKLARLFLDSFSIDDQRYRVVRSDQADDRIIGMANEHRFKPLTRLEAGKAIKQRKNTSDASRKCKQENKITKFRLDSAVDGVNQNRVEKKCSLFILENQDYKLRNNIEFAVVFIAFTTALLQ